MKIPQYMRKYRLEPLEFAQGSGVSIAALYRYLRGENMHRTTAMKIERYTMGECTIDELCPPLPQKTKEEIRV